jgi:DNA-binding beta-propeller fold protein YncE
LPPTSPALRHFWPTHLQRSRRTSSRQRRCRPSSFCFELGWKLLTEAEAVAVDSLTGTVYVSTLVSPTNPAVLAGSVLAINERTNKVVGTIQNVGNLPFSMTLDPLRGKLFASNYFHGSLAVIDLRTNSVTTQVTFPKGFAPDTPAVDPVNGMVYVKRLRRGHGMGRQ